MRDRRAGLASLPLIGGGLTLIGRPTAAAVPVTGALLNTYHQWLGWEHLKAGEALYGAANATRMLRYRDMEGPAFDWHFPQGEIWATRPQEAASRAAVILSAAGVPIGGDT